MELVNDRLIGRIATTRLGSPLTLTRGPVAVKRFPHPASLLKSEKNRKRQQRGRDVLSQTEPSWNRRNDLPRRKEKEAAQPVEGSPLRDASIKSIKSIKFQSFESQAIAKTPYGRSPKFLERGDTRNQNRAWNYRVNTNV